MSDAVLVAAITAGPTLVGSTWAAILGYRKLAANRETRRQAARISLAEQVDQRVGQLLDRQETEISRLSAELDAVRTELEQMRRRDAEHQLVQMERDNLRAANALADRRHADDVARISRLEEQYAETTTSLEAKLASAHAEIARLSALVGLGATLPTEPTPEDS